jgi:methylated-DNA-[protein]-cysteine S-methyltransferase
MIHTTFRAPDPLAPRRRSGRDAATEDSPVRPASGLTLRQHDRPPAGEIVMREVDSPLGALVLLGDGRRLRHLELPSSKRPLAPDPAWARSREAYPDAVEQLERYFAGELRAFELELDLIGTPFQRSVWSLLAEIPFGETWSYGELAGRVGNAAASRAVGAANGRNPIPIVIPCHRVIGSDGSLTGFGGGLEAKRFLLDLEASAAQPGLF